MPVVSGREAVRAFGKIGYVRDHPTGSHVILRHKDPPHRRLTVPDHKELANGEVDFPRSAGVGSLEVLSRAAGANPRQPTRSEH
ncbi:MAG: type II toxin-antitoxin system HicA family toxin [Planctomycetes bacterium]|nr:type II toxin-antitoxin system HicA family toxin [Planctomycetota bacterium]